MNEEYMPDLYSLTDEDGNEQMFELLDCMDYEGETYYALTPYFEDGQQALEDSGAVVILKSEYVDDEETMVTIDDDELYEKIGNMFLERIEAMFDFDDEEEDE
ncbi:MAG: DUF1292 domain-containing protein [Ruminococcus sp.]|nr:DUF1292 domain-containing protein [Ruminococcus sp.]